ncbi:hypothetical protein CONCODRAFT_10336 [Conidiobolus coronatus NRRL 28638]|uniref:Lytic polysaccharide monooxygenase n=1 Tax=Conidiobolus coronatus (strain ATCC 28846 / CBS 209.66 / NRRL 28638) TaxID=796925 RepID=A0A137NY27_CONC2|nr:hypothetical protein CONCODRAFT_10336 [Conidiobolus coronatus NRRL 28638]|eukprot:KXN67571.1 hypothetical protein CONCODRAFT_10336 [Conidiobolus coronatus NRRL 28638]
MLFFGLLSIGLTLAHMEIKSHPPRTSKFSEYYKKVGKIDYDLKSPLSTKDGFAKPYPCKGAPVGPSQAILTAGAKVDLEFDYGAIHNGGHFQLGLSWDNAKTIVTFYTLLKTCFLDGFTIPVTIPASAPPGNATLTWTWVNAAGNREYYMNCVDVTLIGGPKDGKVTGPQNLVANMPGAPTIPEFNVGGDRADLFDKRPIITLP